MIRIQYEERDGEVTITRIEDDYPKRSLFSSLRRAVVDVTKDENGQCKFTVSALGSDGGVMMRRVVTGDRFSRSEFDELLQFIECAKRRWCRMRDKYEEFRQQHEFDLRMLTYSSLGVMINYRRIPVNGISHNYYGVDSVDELPVLICGCMAEFPEHINREYLVEHGLSEEVGSVWNISYGDDRVSMREGTTLDCDEWNTVQRILQKLDEECRAGGCGAVTSASSVVEFDL